MKILSQRRLLSNNLGSKDVENLTKGIVNAFGGRAVNKGDNVIHVVNQYGDVFISRTKLNTFQVDVDLVVNGVDIYFSEKDKHLGRLVGRVFDFFHDLVDDIKSREKEYLVELKRLQDSLKKDQHLIQTLRKVHAF